MTDYIIINGLIVNGKNEPPFPGNIVIENGAIGEITKPKQFRRTSLRSRSWTRKADM